MLHEEHVARIAKEKIYIFTFILTLLLILSFQDDQTKGVKSSKQLGCIHFYVNQVLSDSQHLGFYSAQRYVTIYGYATNWNCIGYNEIYNFLCK